MCCFWGVACHRLKGGGGDPPSGGRGAIRAGVALLSGRVPPRGERDVGAPRPPQRHGTAAGVPTASSPSRVAPRRRWRRLPLAAARGGVRGVRGGGGGQGTADGRRHRTPRAAATGRRVRGRAARSRCPLGPPAADAVPAVSWRRRHGGGRHDRLLARCPWRGMRCRLRPSRALRDRRVTSLEAALGGGAVHLRTSRTTAAAVAAGGVRSCPRWRRLPPGGSAVVVPRALAWSSRPRRSPSPEHRENEPAGVCCAVPPHAP